MTTTQDFLGHPRGLAVLFATEMWERFSYFGNAALVVLYMVKYLLLPGQVETVIGYGAIKGTLEFVFGPLDVQPFASQLFGFYTGLAYFAPVAGGYLADRVLGLRRTIIIGGVLMAVGHFLMAFESLFLFALLALIVGIGAFKPNISTQVGDLYQPGDDRRSRAYSIFYVGINIGAFVAPLICGMLAVAYGWHTGFALAGIGMLVSLAIYFLGSASLPREPRRAELAQSVPFDPAQRRTVIALVVISLVVSFFWAAYDQQGNTIVLWAEDFTDRSIDLGFWRGEIPAPWFLSLNPLMIFIFTPVIVRLWANQAHRGAELPPVAKMALGCLCIALANLLMASAAASPGQHSPWWLVGYFALVTVGELYVAPVGLALMAGTAPAHRRSMMMGVWFACTLPGDVLGGFLGGYWSTISKDGFFTMIAAIAALAAAALWIAGRLLGSALAPKA
jgi:POT family proton-dependent oligopeptide transporter